MIKKGNKTIFILITHGFHVRNILYTDIFSLIKKQCHVVILCSGDDIGHFISEFKEDIVSIEPLVKIKNRLEDILALIRRYILSNPARNKTINVFSMNMKEKNRFFYYLIRLFNQLIGRFKLLRELWLRIEEILIPGKEYNSVFDRYRPDLVVTANYGTQPDEIRILRCAKRYGVKTVSLVQSWDNLSSKGVMGARPDKLVVWNKIMQTEAIEMHDYNDKDIFIAGVPQFDAYARKDLIRSRKEFCKEIGLDPNKKIIVYGTITPKYFPHNIEIINILIENIESGHFEYPCQILIRLHPQVVDEGKWGDRLTDYIELERKFPFIKCDVPKINKWDAISPPDRSDSLHLAEVLHHADVCINPGSTLTIDAAVLETPVIGIGFDGYKEKSYENSIRRWYDFTYYKPIVETGGIKIAYTKEELVRLINAYLKNRSLDGAERKKMVDIECDRIDGKAGQRIADYMFEQIGL